MTSILGNVTNKLLLLSNIQFVESRVYEDEDEAVEAPEVKIEAATTEEKELKFKSDIGNALLAGANFIQTAFEKVEFEQSEDEDDEDFEVGQHLEDVYESKNIYHNRKLPHIIGTQAFLVSFWFPDLDRFNLAENTFL